MHLRSRQSVNTAIQSQKNVAGYVLSDTANFSPTQHT